MSAKRRETYTIKQVAKLSGVSVRALRFYDEIGLLKPAYYGDNGYRYYEKEQLLTLQQVLFYRELRFELAMIHKIIADPEFDRTATLKSHRDQLVRENARTVALIGTIDKTLAHLEREIPMRDAEMYLGFDPKKQAEYENEVIERWGEPAREQIAETKRQTRDWAKSDYEKVQKDYNALHLAFVNEIMRGTKPEAPSVQALVKQHYAVVNRFWTPDRVSYTGLGKTYRDHPDFRKMYDGHHKKLAEYLAQAMAVFAERELK